MIDFLYHRCKSPQEQYKVSLIAKLYLKQRTYVREHVFDTDYRVAQGSVLSAFLFKVYLHEVCKAYPVLTQLILRADLKAYADDIIIQGGSLGEIRSILKEFHKL